MNTTFSRESQIKSMELTVRHAETYLGQFCSLLASYTRKTAKLRDEADKLVRQLNDFSNTEDPELRTCLKNLAEDLAMVQDYRQAEIERLETKVVTPLKAYGDIVKNKTVDLKRLNADRNRELKEIQKLDKLRQKNPADRQSIAEVNAQKAMNNANHTTRQLEETISDFQRQKLEDIKRIFTDFITVEMVFHAKALEVYTHTFQNLDSMDIDKDLELFTGRIRISDCHLDNQNLLTSSMAQHPSISMSSSLRLPAESTKKSGNRILQRQRGVQEEDYEEEDEEEYESETEEAQRSRQSYASQYVHILRQKK